MATLNILIFISLTRHIHTCVDARNLFENTNTRKLFENINTEYLKFLQDAAELTWESSVDPSNPVLAIHAENHQRKLVEWQHDTCEEIFILFDKTEQIQRKDKSKDKIKETIIRQLYLLCKGPRFISGNFKEIREISNIIEELQSIYSDAKICISTTETITKSNLTEIEASILNYLSNIKANLKWHPTSDSEIEDGKNMQGNKVFCLNGEYDVQKMMAFSRNEEVLRWLWLAWRDKVGPPMKKPYKNLVDIQNHAVRRNGLFEDIGQSWREDLEIDHPRQFCRDLYSDIKPLYELLHGVARFFLRKRYGDIVSERGAIPAHLLGNLWSMNWEPLADLIAPKTLDLDESIMKSNWSVIHMVKLAEDFYESLGLPAMTDTFWRQSVFSRENHPNVRCHATAADMFKDDDYRLLYCSGTTAEDFYILHHEMGHIQYYMAYAHLPAIFRQANSFLQESIGDAIMYGVTTPQHLHRLGLINESILYENMNQMEPNLTPNIKEMLEELSQSNTETYFELGNNEFDLQNLFSSDDVLMLKMALKKLPQIPFSLLIDEYRWKYFEGSIQEDNLNKYFWDLAFELQGIKPPEERSETDFDIAAIFHVSDNTPYIRYFLSSFLQHQLFERLCKAAVFGRRYVTDDLPSSVHLMRCDIYGSKAAGKLLRDLMSRGHSQNWREILNATLNDSDNISAAALLRYYRPLQSLMERIVEEYRIPVGW